MYAQTPEPVKPRPMGTPFSEPPLEDGFPGGKGAQETPTPEPTATATATRTPKPDPTATPEPTATAKPGKDRGDLPDTGSEALEIALAGLTLLGFGISLRLRVALADARLRH